MQTTEDLPILMTALDVANFLQVSRNRVYEMMRLNSFPTIALNGGLKSNKRVKRDDLMEWLELNKRQGA